MATKYSDEAARLQRLFAVGHTAFVLTVFSPLLFLALVVGLNADVVYFVGWPFSLLLVFVATALLLPLLHMCVRPTGTLLRLSVWVPCLILACSALFYTVRLGAVRNALESRECLASPGKRSLNLAYQAADDFYGICQTLLGQPPGTVEEVESIADCPDFELTAGAWTKQFHYLASLEARFPCSGVCYAGRRLWFDPGTLAPPCSPFVLQKIRVACIQAEIVFGCSLLLIALLIPSQALLVEPMLEHYNELRCLAEIAKSAAEKGPAPFD